MFYGLLYGYSKERAFLITDIERNFFQKIDNVEATQKIILENQQLNKNLFNHRFDKLEGKLDQNFSNVNDRFDGLESRIDEINLNLKNIINKG